MRRVTLSSVVLVHLVLGAGCLGLGGEPDRIEQAEATLADVKSAIQDVTTYRAQTDSPVSTFFVVWFLVIDA